jgi:hypothetical protein
VSTAGYERRFSGKNSYVHVTERDYTSYWTPFSWWSFIVHKTSRAELPFLTILKSKTYQSNTTFIDKPIIVYTGLNVSTISIHLLALQRIYIKLQYVICTMGSPCLHYTLYIIYFLSSTLKNMRSCGFEWQKAYWKDRLQENEGRSRRKCCSIWASVVFYQYSCKAPWWRLQERPKNVGEF